MVSIAEALGTPQGQMAGDLKAGIELLSASQTVTFTKYNRYVLPFDGYVFWVRADLTQTVAPNPNDTLSGANQITATGSLHVARSKAQDGTETIGINKYIFTTTQNLGQDFNRIGPSSIFVGEMCGQLIAFSDQGDFFQQASLYHYSGDAVYPQMRTQMIESADDFNALSPVVSNSLAVWLSLNSYFPPYPGFNMPSALTLYPSFLVPANIEPPYGVVHIAADATESFGATPFLDSTLGSWQLAKDRVRVTLYGCDYGMAVSFLNFVLQYSEDTSNIGLLNVPIIRDEKLKQAELAILAQKKTIDFEVSYQQAALRNVSRQMITKLVNSYNPLPYTWQNA